MTLSAPWTSSSAGPNASANPDCSTGGTAAGTDKALVGGANTTDGISSADSDNVNTSASKLAPGFDRFRAVGDDSNYDDPAAFTNDTSECFRVRDTLDHHHREGPAPESHGFSQAVRRDHEWQRDSNVLPLHDRQLHGYRDHVRSDHPGQWECSNRQPHHVCLARQHDFVASHLHVQ